MTNELSATADSRSRTFSGPPWPKIVPVSEWWDANSRIVACSAGALFTLPVFLESLVYRFVFTFGRYCALKWRGNSHNVCIYLAYWKVGCAINHSLVSAHFSISAHFLATQTYKRMCLSTWVYGITTMQARRKQIFCLVRPYNIMMCCAHSARKFSTTPTLDRNSAHYGINEAAAYSFSMKKRTVSQAGVWA